MTMEAAWSKRMIDILPHPYMVSQPRTYKFETSSPWKPQGLHM